MPDRATGNSNTWRVLTLRTQTLLNWSSNKPEELVLIKPKLEYSTSFNPQNSNSAKLGLKKIWRTRITGSKTQYTRAKLEPDTCSNSTVWDSMKLELYKNWAWSGTSTYVNIQLQSFFCINSISLLFHCRL